MLSEQALSFWRQMFIMSACLLSSLTGGSMVAFPGVLNPAILATNGTDIRATPSQASWIAMSNGLAGILGYLILPPIMQFFGRRYVQIILNSFMIIGWLLFVFASNLTMLFAARMIQGLKIGGFIINVMTVSEYSNPNRRGYFHASKKICTSLGVLLVHGLSLYYNWRQIAAVCMVPNILSIIIAFFWPESPPYLAMKGRFEECEKSFVWINGDCSRDHKELTALIATQKERLEKKNTMKKKKLWATLVEVVLEKDFKKAFVIVILLVLVLEASGKFYLVFYIIQIMMELIGDKSIAIYCSMGADVLTAISLFVSCFVITCFRRRIVVFVSGLICVLTLLLMSFLYYLKTNTEILSDWYLLIPFITLFYCFFIHLGLVPVCFALLGELFSLDHRGVGSAVAGMTMTAFYALSLKVLPMSIDELGLGYTYLILALTMSISMLPLYFILPETRGKTLVEIEEEMKGINVASEEVKPMLPKLVSKDV